MNGDRRDDVNSPAHQVTNLPNPGIGAGCSCSAPCCSSWQPISTGLVASRMLGLLPVRGLPRRCSCILRLLATGFGFAAGLALLALRPGAVAMTRISLAASAATDLFVYLTPYFPSNRAPGETPVLRPRIPDLSHCVARLSFPLEARRGDLPRRLRTIGAFILTARSVISRPRSMIANASRSSRFGDAQRRVGEERVPAHERVEPFLAEEPRRAPPSRPMCR